jgi:hypothetical protein
MLRALVDELKTKHGEPIKQQVAWAERTLGQKRRK